MNSNRYETDSCALVALYNPIDFGSCDLYLPEGQKKRMRDEALSWPAVRYPNATEFFLKRVAPLGFCVFVSIDAPEFDEVLR